MYSQIELRRAAIVGVVAAASGFAVLASAASPAWAQAGGPGAAVALAPSAAMAPRAPFAPQQTVDEGAILRLVVTLLGLLVLILMGAAWLVYTQGLLR